MSKVILEEENTLFFAHLGATYTVMWRHIQEEQNSQLRHCENVKTYNLEEAGILTLKN